MKKPEYQFEITTQLNAELIKQWQSLWNIAENANVFNSYEFFRTSLESNPKLKYEIFTCLRDGKLAAILPLKTYRQFGFKVSGTISNNFLVDTAFLVEKYDQDLLHFFFKNIIEKNNLYLHKIDRNSARMLHDLFPDLFFTLMSANPYIDYTRDPANSISKSTVSQIKRNFKRNPGMFTFKVFKGSDDLSGHFETMIKIEQNSTKKLKSMDILSKSENKNFYNNLIKNCPGTVCICFLYYNNIPIAYNFGFLSTNTAVAYQTSFLSEYFKLRPGKTMLFQLIDFLKNYQIKQLDLGGGMSVYKLEFTPHFNLYYDLYYSPNKIIMLWWKSINTVRRIKQIFAHEKNNRDHEFLFKTLS